MFAKSENFNENYLAEIVRVEKITVHPNADKLQVVHINGNAVITDLSTQLGDLCVYFPLECAIDANFLLNNNSFQDKALNLDKEKAGFFSTSCRVKAVRLRGQPSEGYLVPVETLSTWLGKSVARDAAAAVGARFDTVDGQLLCKKYIPKPANPKAESTRVGKQKRDKHLFNKMIDGQFALHFDTSHLGRNIHKITPNSLISCTMKIHGTSAVVGNVVCRKKLGWREKLAKLFGVEVNDTEYQMLYSSRRVIKNAHT